MATSTLDVDVFAGRAARDGLPVPLRPRERALLFALASAAGPVPRASLQGLLWPDLGADNARNVTLVTLHRLRRPLGADAIRTLPDGYALADEVRVDVRDAERILARSRSDGALPAADAARAAAIFANGVRHRCESAAGEGAASTGLPAHLDRRLSALLWSLGERLAESASRRGDHRIALELARALIALDECDERARVLAIEAHLELRDRAGAMREYRTYRQALLDELGLEPSREVLDLLEEPVPA